MPLFISKKGTLICMTSRGSKLMLPGTYLMHLLALVHTHSMNMKICLSQINTLHVIQSHALIRTVSRHTSAQGSRHLCIKHQRRLILSRMLVCRKFWLERQKLKRQL